MWTFIRCLYTLLARCTYLYCKIATVRPPARTISSTEHHFKQNEKIIPKAVYSVYDLPPHV